MKSKRKKDNDKKYRHVVIEAINALTTIGDRICENADHDIGLAAHVAMIQRELIGLLKEVDEECKSNDATTGESGKS